MLKKQILKKYKPLSDKAFYFLMYFLACSFCVLVTIIVVYVSRASNWAAIDNLTLLDLDKIDIDQNYKGTTVKALEYLLMAFMNLLACIVITIPLCFARYTRRKQKRLLSLINQIPDDV